jgi:hypothetical protein
MRRCLLVLCLVVSFVGCKKSSTGGGGGGDDDDNMSDGGGSSEPGGTTYSLQWGPVTVPANTEDTQCVILALSNTASIKVHEIHDTIGVGSHHMIVYRDDMDTAAVTTPYNCQPFTGALNTTGKIEPLAITQKMDDDIVLPDGVAYTFSPNQLIKIEMHYINTSDAPEAIQGNVVFTAADASTIQNEAGLLFTGSPDISIPANQPFDLKETFLVPSYLDLSQAHIFAITGHEHHLGTGVQVTSLMSSSDPGTVVYDHLTNFSWSDPTTDQQSPAFSIPAGGGFEFECTWTNTTANTVSFGESACDEMCFFWAYYYPSTSSEVCIHSNQFGGGSGGVDICCPGDAECSLVDAYLSSHAAGSGDTPTCNNM